MIAAWEIAIAGETQRKRKVPVALLMRWTMSPLTEVGAGMEYIDPG
jgi:hypothetical protein